MPYANVNITGRLGRAPEELTSKKGNTILKLSVAHTAQAPDKDPSKGYTFQTMWQDVLVTSPGLVKARGPYLKKGTMVQLTGNLQNQSQELTLEGGKNITVKRAVVICGRYSQLDILTWDKKEDGQPDTTPENEVLDSAIAEKFEDVDSAE